MATNPLAGLEKRCLVWMAGRLPRLGHVRRPDGAGAGCDGLHGPLLRVGARPAGPALAGHCGVGPELVRRQPRRHARASPTAAAAALRLLRRSHRRLLRRALCRDGPCLGWLYDAVHRHGPSDRIFHALDRNIPGDVLSGGVPALLLGRRPDRAPPVARGRHRRPPVRSEECRFWVSTIGCSMWAGRWQRSASPSRSSCPS